MLITNSRFYFDILNLNVLSLCISLNLSSYNVRSYSNLITLLKRITLGFDVTSTDLNEKLNRFGKFADNSLSYI